VILILFFCYSFIGVLVGSSPELVRFAGGDLPLPLVILPDEPVMHSAEIGAAKELLKLPV